MSDIDKDQLISDPARNSLVTANGVILGFALAFFGNWSVSGGKWHLAEIPQVAAFSLGIALLTTALYRSLMPYRQTIARYEVNVRVLMSGILCIFLGVVLVIRP